MRRNPALAALEPLIGAWRATVSNASFLPGPGATLTGTATFSWLDDAFVVLRSEMPGGPPRSTAVIGRAESEPGYSMLYYDERGVSRIWDMTFSADEWTLHRAAPEFHQRFRGVLTGDTITAAWEMSHDEGATWRHDFDITYQLLS